MQSVQLSERGTTFDSARTETAWPSKAIASRSAKARRMRAVCYECNFGQFSELLPLMTFGYRQPTQTSGESWYSNRATFPLSFVNERELAVLLRKSAHACQRIFFSRTIQRPPNTYGASFSEILCDAARESKQSFHCIATCRLGGTCDCWL